MTGKSTPGQDRAGAGTGQGDASPPRSSADRPAPGLYLVATPIGNARDITLRALDVLAGADAIAAEDTRETLKLMEIHGIPRAGRPVVAYHDRNGPAQRPRIMGWLEDGLSVAYCSDAGTPLVADPGYRLVESAIAGGHPVTALPGASAVLAGLSLSGLPTDRFLFAGFLPPKSAARKRELAALASHARHAGLLRERAAQPRHARRYGRGAGTRSSGGTRARVDQAFRDSAARSARRARRDAGAGGPAKGRGGPAGRPGPSRPPPSPRRRSMKRCWPHSRRCR